MVLRKTQRVVLSLVACLGWSQSVGAADTELNKAIAQHRMGTVTIRTEPGADVHVDQLRHEFWFGAALSSGMFSSRANAETAAKYKQVFLENYNSAVTENALKWHSMERRRGQIDYSIVDAMLEWTDQNEIPLRGHNIYWGVSGRVQDWQKQLDDQTLRDVLKDRGLTIAKRYRGRFAEYDLNNEMMHDNYYEKRLGPQITKEMAGWVKEGDPQAVLYLNDYDILTGSQLERFVAHVQAMLDRGVAFDGLGVQGHLHSESFKPEALQNALDTLAKFDLPIRITEFNLPGQRSAYMRDRRRQMTAEQEEAKAKGIVDYYTICFAHPAVDGILMWGFWEGANWIPASSLYKRDWTPTPAAHAYHDLIYKQWWTNWTGKADADGKCTLRAYYGQHRVTVGGQAKTIELKQADGIVRVAVARDSASGI